MAVDLIVNIPIDILQRLIHQNNYVKGVIRFGGYCILSLYVSLRKMQSWLVESRLKESSIVEIYVLKRSLYFLATTCHKTG